MKYITTYILEKANFLVKKHLSKFDGFNNTEYKNLQRGSFAKFVHKTDNRNKEEVLLCKILDNVDERIYLQWYIDIKQHKRVVKLNGSFAYIDLKMGDWMLDEFTNEEIEIALKIQKYFETHKDELPTTNRIQTTGTIIINDL